MSEPGTETKTLAAPSWLKTTAGFWRLKALTLLPAESPTRLIVVLSSAWLGLWGCIDWQERQPNPVLTLDGVPVLGWYVVAVLALAAILRSRSTPRPDLGAVLVLAVAIVPLPLLLITVAADDLNASWLLGLTLAALAYGVAYLWRGMRSITGAAQPMATVLGALFVIGFVFLSGRLNAIPDVWNPLDASATTPEEDLAVRETALFEQADRIDAALETLTRDSAAKPRAFFLGFAGVGDEKVFAQEIGLASRIIGERYESSERQLSLVNDERDLDAAPLASVTGLQYALHGLASHMQLERDVLFLAISSHGSPDPAVAVSNSQLPFTDLTPEDLADALRESGIRWRVIVISACYAGGFIEPLKDPYTVLITAAAADRTSFGCSSDSDLTYFGEAFYRDSLPEATSLRDAFDKAKVAIAARERAEGDEPSEPQAYFGAEAEKYVDALTR
jgi:hypothetical protein